MEWPQTTYNRERYNQVKARIWAVLGGKCVNCGQTEGLLLTCNEPLERTPKLLTMFCKSWPKFIEPILPQMSLRCRPCFNNHRYNKESGMSIKTPRKYPTLNQTFFKGNLRGQINSVFKLRDENPAKVTDYKAALAAGDCSLGHLPLHKSLVEKLQTLGVEVPTKLIKA